MRIHKLLYVAALAVSAILLTASFGQAEENADSKRTSTSVLSVLTSSGSMSRFGNVERADVSLRGFRWGNWSLGPNLVAGINWDFYTSKWLHGVSDFDRKLDGLPYAPVGLQVGKAFSIGSQTMSLSAEFGWTVLQPGGTRTRDWAGSMRIMLLFPE